MRKPILLLITAITIAGHSYSQQLNASTAGRYAKEFARKMYNSIDFEPKKTDYNLSIKRWKSFRYTKDDGNEAMLYMIDITISWKSAQSGWPTTWTDVKYSGILICDEFGCEPNLIIKSKTEPSSRGLAALVVKRSPVGLLKDEQIQGAERRDEWFRGVKYVWNPGGCLD